ncbi:HET-domain-containing protein [Xylariaceae sp. AK1471]|nr:HET-domain-containing protein [Xylariaceae sp. AK1471]
MVQYQYNRLPNNDYIRVATIAAGKVEDDLVIRLENKSFFTEDPPLYEALSYVWGSEDDSQTIQAGDDGNATLDVTRNLGTALRALRFVDRPRDLWVDAICIDQSNDIEKGHQVERMGDIYRLATRVVAWLGPEENESSNAMSRMRYLGSQVTLDKAQQLLPSETCSDPNIADHYVELPFTEQDLSSVYHLICRPWFDRLWIRQEIFLANSSAVIKCGPCEVLWTDFHLALRCMHFKITSDSDLGNQCLDRIGQLKGLIFQSLPLSVREFRDLFGNCQCRDLRDRVYGLQSLLSEAERRLCSPPDYTKPWIQVYQDVARQMISLIDRLNILRDCELASGDPTPSWIPTWWRETTVSLRNIPVLASSTIDAKYEFLGNGVFRVAGVAATIIDESQTIPDLQEATSWREIYEELGKLLPKVGIDEEYTTGINVVEAFARTLVCDGLEDNVKPASYTGARLVGGTQTVEQILSGTGYNEDNFQLASPGREFLIQARTLISNKRFVKCTGGYVGIAPPAAQAGDEVCVLLGCDAPMLLRSLATGGYLVVGECFVEGLSMGEALLGPLPKNTRVANILDEASEQWFTHYLNHQTGETFVEDPRLKELPINLTDFRADLQEYPTAFLQVDLDVFCQRGVSIKYLDLM